MRVIGTMAFVVLCAVASVASAQNQRSDDSFAWNGRIAAGNTVRIRNLAGAINVERSGSGQVEVTGVKHYTRGDAADVRFEVVPEGGDVTICAIWYDGSCGRDGERSNSRRGDDDHRNNDVSVTFTVKLPAGVKIDASGVSANVNVRGATAGVSANSVSGDVTLADVSGEIRLNSVSGDVKVSGASTASIHANSVSGDVEIDVDQLSGSGDFDFSTVSGDVEITFPANLDATIEMSTVSGELTSDFPMSTQGTRRDRNIEAKIGSGGGRVLRFHSVSGNVTLRRG